MKKYNKEENKETLSKLAKICEDLQLVPLVLIVDNDRLNCLSVISTYTQESQYEILSEIVQNLSNRKNISIQTIK